MDSKYAYVRYVKTIKSGDMNDSGKIVQLNYPLEEGTVELVSAEQFKRLKNDFSSAIDGSVIKQDNLVNMLSYFVDKMDEDVQQLPSSCHSRDYLRDLRDEFWRDGKLVADHPSVDAANDLANKVFNLQEKLRIDKMQQAKSNSTSK